MRDDAGEEASACLKLNLWRISALDPGSFNGRTEDFESSNPGSNPGPGATIQYDMAPQVAHVLLSRTVKCNARQQNMEHRFRAEVDAV